MSAPLLIPHRAHFDFSALPQIRVMESFDHAGTAYTGVQNGLWQYDEHYWSERKGAWAGVTPMPAREVVGRLRLAGAAREMFTGAGFVEPLERIESGAPLVAQGETRYRLDFFGFGVPPGVVEARLYSCATGQIAANAGRGGQLGMVADGAYLLWARTYAGEPFETGFGLARIKDGEWSVLRVMVGNGAWSVAAGVCPSPGAALYAKSAAAPEAVVKPDNEAEFRLNFDPLARAVSASCELKKPLRSNDGQFVAPAGALLIGGIRAAASGPQTALWVLHVDGTARIIALQTDFTDGVCECAKTNHFASDIVQAPDGTLFVLTECALFRFDPDALSIYEALQGYPASSLTPEQFVISEGAVAEPGQPGGNCLRFPSAREMVHWTEDLTGRAKSERYFYNRIVRRVSGRDSLGPSTLWHGTNCAEMFLGRLMAVRGERAPTANDGDDAGGADVTGTLYLDWITGGQWQGFMGMKRDLKTTFWQRLRALGAALFVWGYAPGAPVGLDEIAHTTGAQAPEDAPQTVDQAPVASQSAAPGAGDKPLCAVADGVVLRDAAFPFFIRRATVCGVGEGARLLVTARAERDGIGPANRVIEITGSSTHVCSFWNEQITSFALSRAEFESLGGDASKLPAFYVWQPQSGRDGGGVWKAAETPPDTGFWLSTLAGNLTIYFRAQPDGALPYDPDLWSRLCFDILADGSTQGPFIEPTCEHAQCVLDKMPAGTKFRVMRREVPDAGKPVTAFQITDTSENRRLSDERDTYPCLWYRVDSDAARGDLSSYTHLAHYGRLIMPATAATAAIDVVVLVTPQSQPVAAAEMPKVSRRA